MDNLNDTPPPDKQIKEIQELVKINESEFWNQWIAVGVFIFALYPIVKDILNDSSNSFLAVIGAGLGSIFIIKVVGKFALNRELKKKK